MDLSKCTDKKIGHASHELCSRPNAFTVDLLVPTSPTVIEKKRLVVSNSTSIPLIICGSAVLYVKYHLQKKRNFALFF